MANTGNRRQLIVCCDGTSNNITGGQRDTNVVKMLDVLVGDPSQVVYYDPGVGNSGVLPGVTFRDRAQMLKDRIVGLALGRGIYENIAEGYEFLMREYQPGDQLYFFGFSRGAFTARSIAGLVRKFGILPSHMAAMVPTLLHLYFAKRDPDTDRQATDPITDQIRSTFARPESLLMKIHFVGVWDTVASVGAPLFRKRITANSSIAKKPILHVRQALALDEHRAAFVPRLYGDRNGDLGHGQTMGQLWFRGAHCDVGGGYSDCECVVSNEALAWLLDEARRKELRLYERDVRIESLEDIQRIVATRCKFEPRPPEVHSEVHGNCLWAVAGLTVRTTDVVVAQQRVQGEEHPSVAAKALRFPEDTVWNQPRPKLFISVGVLAAIAAFLFLGYLLTGKPPPGGWNDLAGLASIACEYASANGKMALLQLAWWWQGRAGLSEFDSFSSPRGALLGDLLLIGAYAYVLAWFAVHAFARLAGLNRVALVKSRALNLLGLALPTMVLADLAENATTFAVIAIGTECCFAIPFAVLMTLSAATKWAAFAGVVALVLWSLRPSASRAPKN